MATSPSLPPLRRRLRGLPASCHKQLCGGYLREAERLQGRNPAREAELLSLVERWLPYAEAAR
jgi:hypothetical protein